jgi:DNA-binding IclR family transcriptional regulator
MRCSVRLNSALFAAMLAAMAESSIRVIARAVKILDCFVGARGNLGITELSKQTRLSKSTVHHFVTTLVETGLLASDGASRRYRLGPKLAQLGNAFIQSTDLRDLAMPALTELRDLTDETASLHVKFGEQRVTMDQVVSTQGIRRVLNLGVARPIYVGAVGMVLMGDLADQDILRLVKRDRPRQLTPHTVTDPQEILKLVHKARADGYCMLNAQTDDGVGVIAFPIHDHLGAVPAGIVVSGPIHRWNAKTIAPHLKRMKSIVDGVSHQLGRQPSDASSAVARVASR